MICLAAQARLFGQTDDGESRPSGTSSAGRFLTRLQTPLRFSLGVYELSSPQTPAGGNRATSFTMVRPQVLGNVRTSKSQIQFNYAFGYRGYNANTTFHSSEHSGRVDLDRRLSPNLSLQLSDTFRSVFNDYSFLPDSPANVTYQSTFAQTLDIPNERVTTNSLQAGVSYRVNRKIRLTTFTGYDIWRFGSSSFGNVQGVQLGMRGEYRVNKWLFLESSYSHYLNPNASRFLPSGIQRLQFGGFRLRRRRVELFVSGGLDSTRLEGKQRTGAGVQTGIVRNSERMMLSLTYQRGFTIAIGPQALFNGDTVGGSFSRWLSRRINVQVNSGYTRGAALGKDSRLAYISTNAQIQVAVQRHILLSAESSYISQRGRNLTPEAPVLNRHTISTGVQFFFPAFSDRERHPR